MKKHIFRFAIIAFCFWHIFAITVYVIPDEEHNRHVENFEGTYLPYMKPYMFATSQWQKWNIFSPNPIRRVSFYNIEIKEEGRWDTILQINPHNLDWWKRSRELKILRRIEDAGEKSASSYLSYICRTDAAPPGALIRLRKDYYVIPTPSELQKIGGWKNYKPDWQENVMAEYYCPIT